MNTASLMTISPQAGAAVKSQTPRMVAKTDASSAGTSKETFGDVLGKAGGEVKKNMAKSPAEAQRSAQETREAKINGDVPEGAEVLSKNAEEWEKETPQDSDLKQVKDVKEVEVQTPDSAEQIAPAAVMAFTTEGNAQLVQEDIPEEKAIQPSHNLQSILPQSSEAAQKNKDFLAMLSGQQIKTQGLAKDVGQAVNNQAVIEQAFSVGSKTAKETPLTAELLFKQMGMAPVKEEGTARAGTLLEVQLGNHRLANQLPNISLQEAPNGKISVAMTADQGVNLSDNGRDTMLNAKGMALFQQSEVTMPSRAAGEVMDQTRLQQMGADVRNADNMVRIPVNEVVLPRDNMFAGVDFVVENQGGNAALRSQAVDNPAEVEGLSRQEISLPLDNNQTAQNPKAVVMQAVPEGREAQGVNSRQEILPPLSNNQAEAGGQEPQNVNSRQEVPLPLNTNQAEAGVQEPQGVNSRQEVPLPLNTNQAEAGVREPQGVNSRQEVPLPLNTNQAEVGVREPQRVDFRQEVSLSTMNNSQAADIRFALGESVSGQRAATSWTVSEQGAVIRAADRNQAEGTTILESQIAALGGKTKENLVLASQGADSQPMDGRQDPDSRQRLPFTQPVVEKVIDADGQVVQQLAEDAAGDKAAPTKGQEVHNGPVSVFQQDLADSVRGTERQPEVAQNRDVQDNFQVARQIIEQARLIRRGENTEMVIKLHPDHLGELTLKVSVSANGAVNASFHSDNAQVRTIIENSLVQLRQELNNQGLKVDNVDVYAGLNDGQLPQGEGQQAWQQNSSHNGRTDHLGGNLEDYGEDTENETSMQQEGVAADGVDYRV